MITPATKLSVLCVLCLIICGCTNSNNYRKEAKKNEYSAWLITGTDSLDLTTGGKVRAKCTPQSRIVYQCKDTWKGRFYIFWNTDGLEPPRYIVEKELENEK